LDPPPFGQGGIAIHSLANTRESMVFEIRETRGSTSFHPGLFAVAHYVGSWLER
jgi:hypothetical protein